VGPGLAATVSGTTGRSRKLTDEDPAATEFRILLTGSHGKHCAHRSDDTEVD